MIPRRIEKSIEDFYQRNPKKALIVEGVRQCGKTYIIREYGRKNYKCFAEINLLENQAARELLSNPRGTKDLLFRLTSIIDQKLIPGETLIFLDEVQVTADIITWIKFLVEDGRYRYILSGSLLGLELGNVRSMPVGYADIMRMYPLDLCEFFSALGVSDEVLGSVKRAFDQRVPVDEFVHERLMALFRMYLIVGGMPEAVDAYLRTNDLMDVMEAQKSIINLYHLDISKYDPENKLYIRKILDTIPAELSKQNRRFVITSVDGKARIERIKNSFVWLDDAGVSIPVYNAKEPRWPLILSEESNLFKLFMCDVGLLSYMVVGGMQKEILMDSKDIKMGGIYENFAAQELKAHGLDPFYYMNKKRGELDLMVQIGGKVLPIEIKSGKWYKRHSAMTNIVGDPEYGVEEGLVFHNGNVESAGKITYMPIYMVMLLRPAGLEGPMVVKPDLTGLTD